MSTSKLFRALKLCLPVCLLLLSGCSALVARQSQQFADTFSSVIKDSDDPVTIAQGLPSYLLLLDALVKNNPDQPSMLTAAATLNSAYASSFVQDSQRALMFNNKALNYAFAALCRQDKRLCRPRDTPVDELKSIMRTLGKDQAGLLYMAGSVWAGWIQANSADWNAIADLARVEVLMTRVVELDEAYDHGGAHLYLGILATVLTPALGGRPEQGKQHFERALALSGGHNLMAKLYYAKNYARGVFDRELHDRLLQQVLAEDPHAEGYTLSNVLAQQKARELLQSADDYF